MMLAATIVTAADYKRSSAAARTTTLAPLDLAPRLPLLWYALERIPGRPGRPRATTVESRRSAVLGTTRRAGLVLSSASPLLIQKFAQLRSQYSFAVTSSPPIARLGWADLNAMSAPLANWRETGEFLDAYLRPEDPIFDFTNQPALYHFLLGYRPASRYYNVSMAIRRKTQADVMAELSRAPPKLVVYGSRTGGLVGWDGVPNVVRHYDLSRFVLANYRPLATVAGQTFYLVNGADPTPRHALPPSVKFLQPRAGYESGQQCDWGYSPYFLEPEPMVAGPQFIGGASHAAMRIDARGGPPGRTSGVRRRRSWSRRAEGSSAGPRPGCPAPTCHSRSGADSTARGSSL